MENKKKLTTENKVLIGVGIGATVLWGYICYKSGVHNVKRDLSIGFGKMFKVNPQLENDIWDAYVEVKKRRLL